MTTITIKATNTDWHGTQGTTLHLTQSSNLQKNTNSFFNRVTNLQSSDKQKNLTLHPKQDFTVHNYVLDTILSNTRLNIEYKKSAILRVTPDIKLHLTQDTNIH